MTTFLDRLKARMSGRNGFGRSLAPSQRLRELSRDVIRTNIWDDRTWKAARKTDTIDSLIEDLVIGDEYQGGTRKDFDAAPELVKGIFQAFYKAAPQLEHKRRLAREVYPARRIVEEVLENPKLKELQEMTVGDSLMATVAIDAMSEFIREIVGRLPPPPGPQGDEDQQQQPGGQPGDPGDPGQGQPGGQPGGDPGQPSDPDQDNTQAPQGQSGGNAAPGQNDDLDDEGDPGDNAGNTPQHDPIEDDLDNDPGDTDDSDNGEGDGKGDDEDEDDGAGDEEDEEAKREAAEAAWEDAFDELLDDVGIDRLTNKALDAAQREASELDGLRKGVGLEDGEWQSMSPIEKLKMAERLRTPEMRELASVIGQMKRFALGVKATRVVDVPHEAFDVEVGNDLRHILRAQWGLLATKETSYEFYRRYAEKELLQYKLRGTEEVGKGPIVICIDKSTSMEGRPFHWAMGVAEALRRFAAEEDRDYYAIFFGTDNDRTAFDFPEGKGPFEKVMAFLGTVANGGTQFKGVLTEAMEKASTSFDNEGQGKADIVFVTDGEAPLDEAWIRKYVSERERVGVRQYSVYIGGAKDMARKNGPVAQLEMISDAVIPVSDLKPESVRKIFERV